jgi:hypothetical protein
MSEPRVVVFLQENKTTDFYFPTLAAWGAQVANHGHLLASPPNFDQPHDRNAWVHWAMGDYPALAAQIDNDKLIPFYSWLAKTHTFCDHHFALGSNSTSGHMMAKAGELPQICYVWSPSGFDEHPPTASDPKYITRGHDLVWQRVQAVIDGGGWQDTTFILSWDDWGGYADSVATPDIETVPDALHPDGFTAIGGSRIPLIMFGGKVPAGIESTWHSHASIPKTIIDLLGLPAMGIPRVDTAPSLAGRIDHTLARDLPPEFGTPVTQPDPPHPTPAPVPPPAWVGPLRQPMPALVTLDGSDLPAPTDGVVRARPPKPPKPAAAVHDLHPANA